MIKRITLILLSFCCIINAQIALPTFQGVHKPHASAYESGSQTFSYTGAQQTFTVPSGVSTITIQAYGAQGTNGNSPGGLGGYVVGDLTVTAGNTLYDKMLIQVSDESNIAKISSYGFAFGYLGGGFLFLINAVLRAIQVSKYLLAEKYPIPPA